MNRSENLLDPLDQFYLASKLPLPEATKTDPEDIPEPYRTLLVHEDDMTPTLEAAHRQRIHLRLINRHVEGQVLHRQVVLVRDADDKPVEFGAIRIQLNQLSPEARKLVLEGRLPLGRILQDCFIQHESRPVAYFQVPADVLICDALQIESFERLYGRRNRLLMPSGAILAEVVEILPPAEGATKI